MGARLPRTVRSLGLVSLLTDASSEMIYPLLPAFLTGTLRAGPAFLGIVEGLAEAVAAALKIVSGRSSDRLPRRKPLVVAGYSLSSLVRPLVALATAPAHVLVVRLLDRVGKGVRSAPRDALVAEVVAPEDRGRAFGLFHAVTGAALLPASLMTGLLWQRFGTPVALGTGAALAALAALGLLVLVREPPPNGAPIPGGRPPPNGAPIPGGKPARRS
jgi:MFS family permease